jgi:hypothetical protein
VEVGPQLVEARQRRGLTLNDISKSTKIPLSLLRAIECDDAARLPPGFFTRAFVRAYANEVGLDGDELLDEGGRADVEQVAVERVTDVPIQESSSSRSRVFVLALVGVCASYYAGFASHATRSDVRPVVVASAVNRPQPVLAPPPCTPVDSAATPISFVRRTLVAHPTPKTNAPDQIRTTVPVESTAPAVEPRPFVSDAALPEPDPTPPPVSIDQF